MSNGTGAFCIGWVAGASAQVELFSPGAVADGAGYRLKYTPPFRSTIRPPMSDLHLGPGELDPVKQTLGQLVDALGGRSPAAPGAGPPAAPGAGPPAVPGAGPPAAPGAPEVLEQMKWLGVELYTYMVPPYVQSDLRAGQLFLEIGMDEALLNYPWELMHDGQDFLCLKHAVGRYVNAKQQAIPMQQRPASPLGTELETLSVLLISVPRPAARPDGTTFEALPEAEAETDAILDILGGRDGVEVAALIGKDAEYSDVFQALKTGKYHIIHFNGHARFNDKNPYLSGLVLHDRNMTTGPLTSTIGGKPPLLCFVNGCETARSVEPAEPAHHFDIYGLARAFLDTGAYLLGSRWKVQDATASTFAQELYRSLVEEGEAIGNAILKARHACREQVPGDPFGWASYLYYGDPRVAFGML